MITSIQEQQRDLRLAGDMRCSFPGHTAKYDWLVGCFRSSGSFRQYFSLYRAVSQSEGERGEKG